MWYIFGELPSLSKQFEINTSVLQKLYGELRPLSIEKIQ